MCDTCGVTKEQYDKARLVAHQACMATLYENEGVDPAVYGWPRPSQEEADAANEPIQRHHAAHPARGLTREELLAEFAARRR